MNTGADVYPPVQGLPKCYGIIPARYGSTRFPGKPLAMILGKPMFRHVFERARGCPELSEVILATDDPRIMSAAKEGDVPAVMTRMDHNCGSSRVLEAAELLGIADESIVVNIQGDEPTIYPGLISKLLSAFANFDVKVATLATEIDIDKAKRPDIVKVVFSTSRRALYFSRALIPHTQQTPKAKFYGHVGLYAFRMQTLKRFVSLSRSYLESVEGLEQLRLLENGIPIHVILTDHNGVGVDRPGI